MGRERFVACSVYEPHPIMDGIYNPRRSGSRNEKVRHVEAPLLPNQKYNHFELDSEPFVHSSPGGAALVAKTTMSKKISQTIGLGLRLNLYNIGN